MTDFPGTAYEHDHVQVGPFPHCSPVQCALSLQVVCASRIHPSSFASWSILMWHYSPTNLPRKNEVPFHICRGRVQAV